MFNLDLGSLFLNSKENSLNSIEINLLLHFLFSLRDKKLLISADSPRSGSGHSDELLNLSRANNRKVLLTNRLLLVLLDSSKNLIDIETRVSLLVLLLEL